MSRNSVPRLGRGLAALFGEDQGVATKQGVVQPIPIKLLEPNPNQPRGVITAETLEELADSIRAQGVLQPLLVRSRPNTPDRGVSPPDPPGTNTAGLQGPGPDAPHSETEERYEIVAGERRWRAATLAGLTTVPCLILDLTDEQSAAAALVENLQRLDLNGIEEAEGYSRLQQWHGLTQERIADIVGKSRSHVANTLRLLKLPGAVQDHVKSGALSAGHARTLLASPDPVAAAGRLISRQLTVRDAEDLAARTADRRRAAEPDPVDPDLAAVEQTLSDALGVAVSIRCRGGRGTLSLRFSTLDQLDLVIARLDGPLHHAGAGIAGRSGEPP